MQFGGGSGCGLSGGGGVVLGGRGCGDSSAIGRCPHELGPLYIHCCPIGLVLWVVEKVGLCVGGGEGGVSRREGKG